MMNKKVKTRTLENRKGAAPKQALSYRLSLVIRFGDIIFCGMIGRNGVGC
jgi:hypothetical protein